MAGLTDSLIIGAGPYGLSLAAHLRAERANFRIIGHPMGPWRTAMPDGMFLKSEGFASTLFEPGRRFTLGAFCAERGLPYADIGDPVRLETFVAYGLEFQRRFVPNLEERLSVLVRQTGDDFEVACSDGDTIRARKVILASGILHFSHIPAELQDLPAALVSHSSDHHDLSRFNGQEVVVIGAGASAMDLAASLRYGGASVTVVARRPSVRFQTPLGERSFVDKIRAPMTVVGPGWKSVLCTRAPLLFHYMPDWFRSDVVRRFLGPAPGWFAREHVEGYVPIMTGTTITRVSERQGRAELTLTGSDQQTTTLLADHVIAATGFKADVDRIDFLDARLRTRIDRVDGFPRLSPHFESSVPGLYFVGLASANSFGPMVRFAAGAGFTARRLSRRLAAVSSADRTAKIAPSRADAVPADR
jgi:thioredoxin reductase